MSEAEGGIQNILRSLTRRVDRREQEINISLTPQASAYLRQLITRPNPRLAEFPFLGLGKQGVIDKILAPEEYSLESGLSQEGYGVINVERTDLQILFQNLEQSGRKNDLMILGHLHPTGQTVLKGRQYDVVEPDDLLLVPSMGSKDTGGPTSGGDLAFIKSFLKLNPTIKLPYVGIAANTQEGARLRIYKPEDLLGLKRCNDIDKLPKQTIEL